jgi:hypothetical protein
MLRKKSFVLKSFEKHFVFVDVRWSNIFQDFCAKNVMSNNLKALLAQKAGEKSTSVRQFDK